MELKKSDFGRIPNKIKIEEFADLIRDRLFPNYFHEIHDESLLEDTCRFYFRNYIDKSAKSEDRFFSSLKGIYSSLLTDLEMTFDSDPACASVEVALITYPGIYAIMIYRIAHLLYQMDLKIVARILSESAHGKTGIDIHPGAQIGNYFFIDHGTGIVIGETAVIGHHVKIYQGVTLGAISLSRGQQMKGMKRHPTIGNDVTIYSGASILGGETIIGDNVVIGSNVFLTRSVSANKKVINKEAEIVMKEKEQ